MLARESRPLGKSRICRGVFLLLIGWCGVVWGGFQVLAGTSTGTSSRRGKSSEQRPKARASAPTHFSPGTGNQRAGRKINGVGSGRAPPTLGLEVNIRAQRHPRIPSKSQSIQAVGGDALWVRLDTIRSLPRTNPAQQNGGTDRHDPGREHVVAGARIHRYRRALPSRLTSFRESARADG